MRGVDLTGFPCIIVHARIRFLPPFSVAGLGGSDDGPVLDHMTIN